MCRPRSAADLGLGAMVLGIHAQRDQPQGIRDTSSHHVHCLATGGHGVCIRILNVPRIARVLSPGASTKGIPLTCQIPPYVPNFFKTLIRRKLVIWFMVAEVLRDYWLSPVYGRSWQFLWAMADVPKWAIVIEIAVFFIGIWGLFMGLLISASADYHILHY